MHIRPVTLEQLFTRSDCSCANRTSTFCTKYIDKHITFASRILLFLLLASSSSMLYIIRFDINVVATWSLSSLHPLDESCVLTKPWLSYQAAKFAVKQLTTNFLNRLLFLSRFVTIPV